MTPLRGPKMYLSCIFGYNNVTPSGLQPIKKKTLVIFNREMFKKIQVFLLEGLFPMVFFLLENVLVHRIDLGVAIRKSTIALLPGKRLL